MQRRPLLRPYLNTRHWEKTRSRKGVWSEYESNPGKKSPMATLKGEIDFSFTIWASCLILSFSEEESTLRRKIRLMEVKQNVVITCTGTLRLVFIRVYRLEIQSVMLVFWPSFVNCCPSNLLSGSTLTYHPIKRQIRRNVYFSLTLCGGLPVDLLFALLVAEYYFTIDNWHLLRGHPCSCTR